MFDYSKCLNSYGNLSKSAYYMQKCNCVPSIYAYSFDKRQINLDIIDDKKLKEIFPNLIETWSTRSQTEATTSAVDENKRDDELIIGDEDVYIDGHYQDISITIFEDNILWEIKTSGISCFFNGDVNIIKEKIKYLLSKLPFKEEKPKEAEVKLVAYDGRDYYTITSKVKETEINLQENYNDDFLPVYDDIIKFLDQRESGLIMLSGEIGSGKSYLIRHLLSQHPKEYIIVTNTIASHLANPEFVAFMLEHKDSIFILEDCEQLIMDRSENVFNSAISNILNMADGLMSDIFNVKFICTFNADINKIDPALLRKGRCYARYEFGKLSVDKVEKFCKSHNIELPEYKEMTLGELYNQDVSDDYKIDKPKKKVGF